MNDSTSPEATSSPLLLGARYRDVFTRIEGIATARTERLYGAISWELTFNHDGKEATQWFAQQRLELVEKAKKETPGF